MEWLSLEANPRTAAQCQHRWEHGPCAQIFGVQGSGDMVVLSLLGTELRLGAWEGSPLEEGLLI